MNKNVKLMMPILIFTAVLVIIVSIQTANITVQKSLQAPVLKGTNLGSYVYYKFSVNILNKTLPVTQVLVIDKLPYPVAKLPNTFLFFNGSIHNYTFASKVIGNFGVVYTFVDVVGCGFNASSAQFDATHNCTAVAYYNVAPNLPNASTTSIPITSTASTTLPTTTAVYTNYTATTRHCTFYFLMCWSYS